MKAAMEFLRLTLSIERGPEHYEGIKDLGRTMTKEEVAARQAAVEMLRLYFSGELTLGDEAPAPRADGGPEDPKVPVNVQ